jgi:hypothetical protein
MLRNPLQAALRAAQMPIDETKVVSLGGPATSLDAIADHIEHTEKRINDRNARVAKENESDEAELARLRHRLIAELARRNLGIDKVADDGTVP